MMTTASLFAFFSKPPVIVSAFRRLFRGPGREADVLRAHRAARCGSSLWGIPLVGAVVVLMAHWFFGVAWWMAALAIPMIFVFTLIAVNSTGAHRHHADRGHGQAHPAHLRRPRARATSPPTW